MAVRVAKKLRLSISIIHYKTKRTLSSQKNNTITAITHETNKENLNPAQQTIKKFFIISYLFLAKKIISGMAELRIPYLKEKYRNLRGYDFGEKTWAENPASR